MELTTILGVLHRRWWLITVTLLVTLGVIAIGTSLAAPIYEASATLRVLTASGGSLDWVQYDIQYTDRLMNTYIEIATSHHTLVELAQRFGLNQPPQVSAEVVAESELMRIYVQDSDPRLARDMTNALADILIEQSEALYERQETSALEMLEERLKQAEDELNQVRAEYEALVIEADAEASAVAAAARTVDLREEAFSILLQQYEQARVREVFHVNTLSVVEPARLPTTPNSPKPLFNLALGALVGLFGGIGLALVFDNLDTTLHTTAQIEAATESMPLATIPKARRQRQVSLFDRRSKQDEAFHRLRVRIQALDPQGDLRKLLVTSAEPKEGKSTMVANLAATMAYSGRQIVIVDCDLRHPVLHETFALPNDAGLSEVLRGKSTLDDVLQKSHIPGLWVLVSGSLPKYPAELLGTTKMARLIEQMVNRFDVVLLDTPAFQAAADVTVLLSMVDGALVIVGRGKARREAVRDTLRQLIGAGARIVGIVVNWSDNVDGYGNDLYT